MCCEGIGVCPQHDVLFDNLTVREHILLASQLKGFSCHQANEEAVRLTNLFHLDKRLGRFNSNYFYRLYVDGDTYDRRSYGMTS